MDRHMILIGFMGAGKTTVGRCLSSRMSRELLDMDEMIESEAGMTISRIFETSGEEAFRRIESEVLKKLAEWKEPAVISTGGGAPLREENRKLLSAMGTVVYLQVLPETVLVRLSGDTARPLLQGDGREEKVRQLLVSRDPIYRQAAHMTVKTDGRSPEEIAGEILKGDMKR